MDTKREDLETAKKLPWRVFLADGDAEVVTDPEEIAAMLLDEDLMGGTISIRRASALPGEDGCLPGTWTSNDLFLEIELGDVLPEDGIATWELVQKAAWGMNQDIDMAALAREGDAK